MVRAHIFQMQFVVQETLRVDSARPSGLVVVLVGKVGGREHDGIIECSSNLIERMRGQGEAHGGVKA